MAEHEVRQRLAAILAADVAGYSRLMGDDERTTIDALNACRDLFRSAIEGHAGRVVDMAGDSVLAVFDTAIGAADAALAAQTEILKFNANRPSDRHMLYRIGVNMGDIHEQADGSIYGDGVNVAARLEGLSEPGGICVSGKVRDELRGKIARSFADLGEHNVKNIAEPVRAYRILAEGEAPAARARVSPQRWAVAAVAAVAILSVIAVVTGLYPGTSDSEHTVLALPDRPSIAVLPFTNLSDSASQEYLADGLSEDLITDLSKIPAFFVIARNSSFSYKGKSVKVQEVAADLGVRYILEGSIRRTGDVLRINAQLIDSSDGSHVWADRYDGAADDILRFQDQVLAEIVANMSAELGQSTIPLPAADTTSPEAYDAYLQGREILRGGAADLVEEAIRHFAEAVALDPAFGRAYAGLARAYWRIVKYEWEFAIGSRWQHAYDNALTALDEASKYPTAEAYALRADILADWGRHDEALVALDQALKLAPNVAEVHAGAARVYNYIGRPEDAEQSIRTAMRLDPHYPPDYPRLLGLALFHRQHYAQAAALIERAVTRQLGIYEDQLTLASAYGHLGRRDAARAAIERYAGHMVEDFGNYTRPTVQEAGLWWYRNLFDADRASIERFQSGLRKADLEAGAGEPERFAEFRAIISRNATGEYFVDGATEIDVATAKDMHNAGAQIIDVRDQGSFDRGHIPAAHHLDLNVGLSQAALGALVAKDEPVIFHCWGKYCPYSAYAAAKAIVWGFTRVYRLPGGLPAWEDADLPTEETAAQ
jgi:adenylate cyclase